MTAIRILILALFAALPLAGQAQDTTQPEGTIAVEEDAGQDAAIARRIRSILSQLEEFRGVSVSVQSGIVTFRGTTVDAGSAERLSEIASRVEGVVTIRNQVAESTDVAERLNPALARFRARLLQFVQMLPLLSVAFAVFAVVTAIGVYAGRARWPWDRIAPNAFIADIYRQIVVILFLVIGLVVALDILGATALLSTILGAAGIVGLAIGFAVRDTVENFIASILLSVRQPFRPNDLVEIEGDLGKVIRLTSRATILLSLDGNQIRIPNATVFKARIVNFTRNDERRFLVDLGVAYDTDLAAAQALALETVRDLTFTLEAPAPVVWIEELGDSAVIIRVAGWIDQTRTDFARARSEAFRLCLAAFDATGIHMPEPTFRILGPEAAWSGAEAPPPSRHRPPPTPQDLAPAETATTADADLERIAATERDQSAEDLLTRSAPTE